MKEIVPENEAPLNQLAKEKLGQVAQPDPEFLYALQLMQWARRQGEVTPPGNREVREEAGQFLNTLLGAKHGRAWKWLVHPDDEPDLELEHPKLDPEWLHSQSPAEVAANLLEVYYDRLSSTLSQGLDQTPET